MERHKSRDRLGCPTLSTRVPSRMEKDVYVFFGLRFILLGRMSCQQKGQRVGVVCELKGV